MTPANAYRINEVLPYLIARDAAAAIRFYSDAFGATEDFRISGDDGTVAHAELRFGTALVMIADEFPDAGILSPLSVGGTGSRLHLHVENVDAIAERAVDAGATYLMEPTDQPHGERQCRLRDPFGHEWLLGHPIEAVSREEMQRRYAESEQG
ncbi:MAG: VOC family protein [Chloroflexota bacterium]